MPKTQVNTVKFVLTVLYFRYILDHQRLDLSMTALDNLKRLLPLDSQIPDLPLDASSDQPLVDDLPLDDLNKLVDKFQQYQHDLSNHKNKLEPIAKALNQFNQELDTLSTSLISLQKQSAKISSDAKLHQTITEKLSPVILDLLLPPDIVKSVIMGEITPQWTENLRFINEKIQMVQSIDETHKYYGSKALDQLKEGIELLIFKCVEKIRDFIIAQIKLLRSSVKISSQTIQQQLLVVKDAFVFLQTYHKELANQLQLAYIYTMRWYYVGRFAKYLYALQNLNVRHVDLNVVLGFSNEDKLGMFGIGLKSWLSPASPALTPPNGAGPAAGIVTIHDYLPSVEKRREILEIKIIEPNSAIPSQIAETTPFSYWLEFIYNQWSIALVDNIVVEYLFMVDFFYQGNEKFESDWSHVMFDGVFKMGREFVGWLITHYPVNHAKVSGSQTTARVNLAAAAATAAASATSMGSCDAYAILLIIRLIQGTQSRLHNEFRIPILDDYLNSLLMILWPHFTKVIDLNCESLKKGVIRSGRDTSLAPVSVTQQFAQFLLGLLKLSLSNKEKNFKGEPLFISISRLRNDFETCLTKLTNHYFGSGLTKLTEKEIFLYNNYFLVMTILKNEHEDIEANGLVSDQVEHFEALCDAYKQH